MGNSSSASREVLQSLRASTSFSEDDINRLYARFKVLNVNNENGKLSREVLLEIPEFAVQPLVARVLSDSLAVTGGDGVSFEEFVKVLDVFSPSGSNAAKLDLLFGVIDHDGDGLIGVEELAEIWKLMVTAGWPMHPEGAVWWCQIHLPLTEEQLMTAAEQALTRGDHDEDGKWSRMEFEKVTLDSKGCSHVGGVGARQH
eukprot:TRINITY_DN5501_c0_g1_i7.p1 TRINITY_DN5501_c0_g1~~TRINITY_DN5501_c0_g1_i7.p1  ORF type:complete len:200 (-),score=46.10 TRINITY_DN5501_c0_g1_i7:7-606(-)